MTRIRGRGLARLLGTGRKEFGNTEIALRGRRQEIVLGIEVGVQI